MPKDQASKVLNAPLVVFETIEPERIASLNAIYRRRSPVEVVVAGEVVTFAAVWPTVGTPGNAQGAILFTLGETPGAIVAPLSFLEYWLTRADPECEPSQLSPQHCALLLEAFLSDEIEWLERKLRSRIELTGIERQAQFNDGRAFNFTLMTEIGENLASLRLDDLSISVQLGDLLDKAVGETVIHGDLTVPLVVLLGAALIDAGQLSELAPGDVILVDDAEGEASSGLVSIGNRFVAPVHIAGGEVQMTAQIRRFTNSKWEWIMNHTAEAGYALEDADFDDLPVALVFEIGRTALTIDEVKKLAPGSIVPLKETTSEIVEVVANGKRIGRGEIVQIGESVGVRLVRVFGHA